MGIPKSYRETLNVKKCNKCDSLIAFTKTDKGKWLVCDVFHVDGNDVIAYLNIKNRKPYYILHKCKG